MELSPVVGALEHASHADIPLRQVTDQLIEVFVREIFETRRKDVIRLVITEGPRFPKLAEFYYREVISRVMEAIRAMLRRAVERGELKTDALVRFPQLAGRARHRRDHLERFVRSLRAARCPRADARAFRSAARQQERVMIARRIAVIGALMLALAACSAVRGPRLPGLGRGRSDLRQPRRGRPGRDAVGARRRRGGKGRAAVHRRSRSATGRRRDGEGVADQRHARPTSARRRCSRPRPARRRRWRTPRRRCAPPRRGSPRRRRGWRAARRQARSPARCSRSTTGRANWCRPAGRWCRCCRRATSRSGFSCRRRCCRRSRSASR